MPPNFSLRGATNKDSLKQILMTAGYDEEVATKAINLWQSKLMPEREIRAALINGGPELEHIFSIGSTQISAGLS